MMNSQALRVEQEAQPKIKLEGDPLTVISFGGGVQSTALALLNATKDPRLLKSMGRFADHAIFADTQNEAQGTYQSVEIIKKFCSEKGFEIHISTLGDLSEHLFNQTGAATSIPFHMKKKNGGKGKLPRQCTRDFKIDAIRFKIRGLLGLKKGQWVRRPVVSWIGISRDEADRMKPSRITWMRNEFPLIDLGWTRKDCAEYIESTGLPVPPKSACVFCPYHSDAYWRYLREKCPEDWKAAVDFDHEIRERPIRGLRETPFLHQSLQPLEMVELNGKSRGHFAEECEGLCGV